MTFFIQKIFVILFKIVVITVIRSLFCPFLPRENENFESVCIYKRGKSIGLPNILQPIYTLVMTESSINISQFSSSDEISEFSSTNESTSSNSAVDVEVVSETDFEGNENDTKCTVNDSKSKTILMENSLVEIEENPLVEEFILNYGKENIVQIESDPIIDNFISNYGNECI